MALPRVYLGFLCARGIGFCWLCSIRQNLEIPRGFEKKSIALDTKSHSQTNTRCQIFGARSCGFCIAWFLTITKTMHTVSVNRALLGLPKNKYLFQKKRRPMFSKFQLRPGALTSCSTTSSNPTATSKQNI
jgi:hypothetical protein